MAFRCEKPDENAREKVCEADVDLPCDDVCARYAANAACGSKRCDADADCARKLSCDILDGNNQPTGQFFDCSITFACRVDTEVCESSYTVPDAQLCASCCRDPSRACCEILGLPCG